MLGLSLWNDMDEFYYFDDMVSAGGGVEASSVVRVRSGRRKFREMLPFSTNKGHPVGAKTVVRGLR